MKNFFVFWSLFAVLIFVASCGDVTVNAPGNGDSGNSTSDKTDTGDSGQTDTGPSGGDTEVPDDTNTTPEPEPDDDADSTPAGNDNDQVDECEPGTFTCNQDFYSYICTNGLYRKYELCKVGCDSLNGKCKPWTDPDTNLTWSSLKSYKNDSNTNDFGLNWEEAVFYCDSLSEGYSSWRLPDIDELRTLIVDCPGTVTGGSCKVSENNCLSSVDSDDCWTEDCYNCSTDKTGKHSKLSEMDPNPFWSSSTQELFDTTAWGVDFRDASIGNYERKTPFPVRCVKYCKLGNIACQTGDGEEYLSKCNDNREYSLRYETCKGGCDISNKKCKIWKDPDTNLTWSSRTEELTWNDAVSYCDNLSEGGFSDWRLPNIDELRTLILNCSGTETGGSCKISEKNDCLSHDECWTQNDCCCSREEAAPSSKTGDTFDGGMIVLWSSSTQSDNPDVAWYLSFHYYTIF